MKITEILFKKTPIEVLDYVIQNKDPVFLKHQLSLHSTNTCYHKNPNKKCKIKKKMTLFLYKDFENENYGYTIISDCKNRTLDKEECRVYKHEKYVELSEKDIFYLQINL